MSTSDRDEFISNGPGEHTDAFGVGVMSKLLAAAGQHSPFMRLFPAVYGILAKTLDLDASVFLISMAGVWGLIKLVQQVYQWMNRYYTASITFAEGTPTYDEVMYFMRTHPSAKRYRRVAVETLAKQHSTVTQSMMPEELFCTPVGDHKYTNYSKMASRMNRKYVPAEGSSTFWYKGRWYRFMLQTRSYTDGFGLTTAMRNVNKITIECYGRSTKPLSEFLDDAASLYPTDCGKRTRINVVAPKGLQIPGKMWVLAEEIPVRCMNTTAKKYRDGGIPWRRGYVLSGPPGTGKTSFCFAAAGLFGLQIHVVSLQGPDMTDDVLRAMMTNLPERCIVLIEDVDTAGLRRDGDSEAGKETARNVSLSGLLNAIDGITGASGRILLMTTNRLESLDEALLRPGRVDQKLKFTNASKEQAKGIFRRMCGPSAPSEPLENFKRQSVPSRKEMERLWQDYEKAIVNYNKLSEIVEQASKNFSELIVGGQFSPAEIENFLLENLDDPEQAVKAAKARFGKKDTLPKIEAERWIC